MTHAPDAFLKAYRDAFQHQYDQWDFQTIGAAYSQEYRITAPDLEAMYLPLRLGKGYDYKKLGEGAVLPPEDVPKRKHPLLICGPAGCGKTTWMRHTFRKLLGLPDCLPIMLELRKLAKYWSARREAGHNLDLSVFLEEEVLKPTLMEDCNGKMHLLFGASSGPIPVLLVDGWDELGDLGRELRTRLLTLAGKYPRLRIVATSRPAADRMPDTADHYTIRDLQPLNDAEVLAFAGNFCTHCYPGDTAAKQAALATFEDALAKAEGAAELVRSPLLLTMMLFISRTRPLPDKRFRLYEACVENLLADLPEEKQRDGARSMRTHWCPPDRGARLRVLGRLAHDLQVKGYKKGGRAVAVVQPEELAEMLPRDWREVERYSFIAWLVERAGLLVDLTDGSLTFVHLSFQEFLTAHYLKRTLEGDQNCLQLVHTYVGNRQWWETLRLWAALENREDPGRIDALSGILVKDAGDAFWLMGAFFADGLGNEEAFGEWADRAIAHVATGYEEIQDVCAGFWKRSRQDEPRAQLKAKLIAVAQTQNWPAFVRLAEWANHAGHDPAEWMNDLMGFRQTLLRICWTQEEHTPRDIAITRFLMGCHPTWGGGLPMWTLLRCWPGRRLFIGSRVQNMATFGYTEKDLNKVFGHRCSTPEKDKIVKLVACVVGELASDLSSDLFSKVSSDLFYNFYRHFSYDLSNDLFRDFSSAFSRDFSGAFSRDLASELSRNLSNDLASELATGLAHYLANYLASDLASDLSRDIANNFVHYFVRFLALPLARDLASDFARHFTRILAKKPRFPLDFLQGLDLPDTPTSTAFAESELGSVYRFGPRAFLAHVISDDPLIHLLSQASLCSLMSQASNDAFHEALAKLPSETHPMWPALARHMARCSSVEDRDLLETLARDPEAHRAELGDELADCLRYLVRGDVILEDDTEVTLNDLCDQAGVPHLPYLTDMPPELEIDWDAGKTKKSKKRGA